MNRRQNFQTIAWFNDLHKRDLLNLDPPYQRRSVWTQSFRNYFIETILLDYPAPTIFLYEEISDTGITTYNVVDGKQRLSTIFSFLRGRYFQELSTDVKNNFWSYTFSVEYLPTKNESIINNIFDRINRNVAKLTSQELRHAKYSGPFIRTAEDLTDWMYERLPTNFPQIAKRSKAQMKDVELTAQILLRLEGEPRGYSTEELDLAFGEREDYWEEQDRIIDKFQTCIKTLKEIIDSDSDNTLVRSRLRNQADFYSLLGAIYSLSKEEQLPEQEVIRDRLVTFLNHEISDDSPLELKNYYEYARVASNRTQARRERERILKKIILDEIDF